MENNLHTKNKIESHWYGVGFFDVLLIVFVVLKLCHIIDWPWIWVLSPLWGACILVGLLLLLVGIVSYFVDRIDK